LAPARADGHHSGNVSYGHAIASLSPSRPPSRPYLFEVDHPDSSNHSHLPVTPAPRSATARETHHSRPDPSTVNPAAEPDRKGRGKGPRRRRPTERMNGVNSFETTTIYYKRGPCPVQYGIETVTKKKIKHKYISYKKRKKRTEKIEKRKKGKRR